MNNLRRTLLLTLPLIGSGSLLAQNAMNAGLHLGIDPISFFSSDSGGDGVPVVNARYMHRFDSDFDSLAGEISSDEFSVITPILPLTYDRLRVAAFASYRANWIDTSTPTLIPDDTLHALRLPVVAAYELSDKWLLGGMVMPGLSGDLENADDGFSILSILGVGYGYSDRLKIFAGALHSYGFDENHFFPGAGFLWQASDDLSVSVLPPFASVTYSGWEDYKLSLFGRYDSPTWNVEADAAGPDRDINLRELRVGLRLERRLTEKSWAYLGTGFTFARRLEIETTSSSSLQEDDIDPGLFLQGGLSLRF
jgi:hypothetical protein